MKHLLTKYLNSVVVFEGPNDQGTQSEKPKIEVDSVDNRNKPHVSLNGEDAPNEDNPDPDEDEEDDIDPNAPENETAEQERDRLAKEKEDRKQARIQKRIDKLTASNGEKDKEIAALRAQLNEKPKEGLTEEEIERRAAEKAQLLADQKETARLEREFQKNADSLIKAANKIDKDFETKIKEVASDTDTLMPKEMVEVLAELDHKNGHEILALMANDADMYEEICTMPMRKMIKHLDKMSEELFNKSKNKTKTARERERLPDPIVPINDGTNNRGNQLPSKPTQNMDDYVRIRAEQTAQARKQGKNVW